MPHYVTFNRQTWYVSWDSCMVFEVCVQFARVVWDRDSVMNARTQFVRCVHQHDAPWYNVGLTYSRWDLRTVCDTERLMLSASWDSVSLGMMDWLADGLMDYLPKWIENQQKIEQTSSQNCQNKSNKNRPKSIKNKEKIQKNDSKSSKNRLKFYKNR